MTEKRERGQSKDWYGRTKSRWQQPAGGEGGSISRDAWDTAKLKGKWKEISAEIGAVGITVKKSQTLGTKVAKKVRREKPNSSP